MFRMLAAPPSASACDRSKRRRFGCRRTAKLRALTCGGCLSEDPWVAASSTARRRLFRAQVAPIAPLRGAVGAAGCRARFFAFFLAVQQERRSPAGANSRHLREAQTSPLRTQTLAATRPRQAPASDRQQSNTTPVKKLATSFCAKRRYRQLRQASTHRHQNTTRPRQQPIPHRQATFGKAHAPAFAVDLHVRLYPVAQLR